MPAADVISDVVARAALHCVYIKCGHVSLLPTQTTAALQGNGSIHCSTRVVFHGQGAMSCLLNSSTD